MYDLKQVIKPLQATNYLHIMQIWSYLETFIKLTIFRNCYLMSLTFPSSFSLSRMRNSITSLMRLFLKVLWVGPYHGALYHVLFIYLSSTHSKGHGTIVSAQQSFITLNWIFSHFHPNYLNDIASLAKNIYHYVSILNINCSKRSEEFSCQWHFVVELWNVEFYLQYKDPIMVVVHSG